MPKKKKFNLITALPKILRAFTGVAVGIEAAAAALPDVSTTQAIPPAIVIGAIAAGLEAARTFIKPRKDSIL